jgi:hypothetical protein
MHTALISVKWTAIASWCSTLAVGHLTCPFWTSTMESSRFWHLLLYNSKPNEFAAINYILFYQEKFVCNLGKII